MKSNLFVTIGVLAVSAAAAGQQQTTVPAFFALDQHTVPLNPYDWT